MSYTEGELIVPRNVEDRITSYNVCYTKLLRHSKMICPAGKPLPRSAVPTGASAVTSRPQPVDGQRVAGASAADA